MTAVAAATCPLCWEAAPDLLYDLPVGTIRRCRRCGHAFTDPQPSDADLARIYTAGYFLAGDDAASLERVSRMKRRTAEGYLDILARRGITSGRLLEVGCGNGELLAAARARGFEVAGCDVNEDSVERVNRVLGAGVVTLGGLERVTPPEGGFDVCVCIDVIEHLRDPIAFLEQLHSRLAPGGALLLTTPDIGSPGARRLGARWFEFKTEHLHYFDRGRLVGALQRTGFLPVELDVNRRHLTLEYLADHFRRFPVRLLTPLVTLADRALPDALRRWQMRLPTTAVTVVATTQPRRERPLLSVIVPAYREAATVTTLLERVLDKRVEGLDKEVIVVEGNSDDGTREQVLAFASRPDVHVVLLDRARGKGDAVKRGLAVARGDIVLIQDADLEYDVDDYDALLQPLLAYERHFVLGSRHRGSWKVRRFIAEPMVAQALNLGHLFLTGMFNLLYGQRLTDPWTMYKVFRRGCLAGLRLRNDRFDFDVELVAKLVRSGYAPVEIPVNYASRGFTEGKKVHPFRDPPSWIWTLLRCRVAS